MKRAAPLFETDIYALVAMEDTSSCKLNTVYIFDALRKEVVSQHSIDSSVTDVHFVRFDKKSDDGSVHKVDSVVFFGFDEVFICNPDKFDVFKSIKGNKDLGKCTAVLQEKGPKKLAFLGSSPDEVQIIDMNNEFNCSSFKPLKGGYQPSFLSFSDDVGSTLVQGQYSSSCRHECQ